MGEGATAERGAQTSTGADGLVDDDGVVGQQRADGGAHLAGVERARRQGRPSCVHRRPGDVGADPLGQRQQRAENVVTG